MRVQRIHAPASATRNTEHVTLCGELQRRRYVHIVPGRPNVGAFTSSPVNCPKCLLAMSAYAPDEYFLVAGIPMLSANQLPILQCKDCGNWDEHTSESSACGICARCMHDYNKPEAP